MKKITAIVRPEKLGPLKEALCAADVAGMTVSQVHGCGAQHGWTECLRSNKVLLNTVPKVKFEIVADGTMFVFPVEEAIHIRTGERGTKAV